MHNGLDLQSLYYTNAKWKTTALIQEDISNHLSNVQLLSTCVYFSTDHGVNTGGHSEVQCTGDPPEHLSILLCIYSHDPSGWGLAESLKTSFPETSKYMNDIFS